MLEHPIDLPRYRSVMLKAMNDVATAFGALQRGRTGEARREVYLEFCNVDPSTSFFPGVRSTMTLIKRVTRDLGFNKVRFVPFDLSHVTPKDGWASWLFVDRKNKELIITYDWEKMARIMPLPAGLTRADIQRLIKQPTVAFSCAKILSKTLLHELGHASLHYHIYEEMLQAGRGALSVFGLQIRLDLECEPEAWLYSLIAWGILTGDHSYAGRAGGTADEGYVLC